MPTLLDQAIAQLGQINSFLTFGAVLEGEDRKRRYLVHPAFRGTHQWGLPHRGVPQPPGVPPPEMSVPDPLQRRTLDPDIWHGLGVVGMWAAIDAFRERKNQPDAALPGVVHAALAANASPLVDIWGDLCDLRHLFAHKFAGQADDYYWYRDGPACTKSRPHYRFKQAVTVPLTSGTGTQFQHDAVQLTSRDLDFYVRQGRAIVTALDTAWP